MFKQLIAFSDSSPSLSIGDKFSLSLTTLLLGMLVVFAVLLIIMLVVLLQLNGVAVKNKPTHVDAVGIAAYA